MNTTRLIIIMMLAALTFSGCASHELFPGHQASSGGYVRSSRAVIQEYQPVPVVRPVKRVVESAYTPEPIALPAISYPSMQTVAKPRKVSSGNPLKAVQSANQDARHSPDETGYENAIMRYTFESGGLYEVYAAPLRLTDIQLQPGEKILGKPAAGDTVRWVLGVNESVEDGKPQQHILIKPTASGLSTTLIINTNRRTYLLELSSHKKTWMAAVRWQYPQDEVREVQNRQQESLRQQQIQQQVTAKDIDLDNLNFAYAIQGKGNKPVWTPIQVFDDGRRVFIRFPNERQQYEAPALFVVSEQGESQLVNYRVQNDYYIVDRLFMSAELRVGQKNPSVVRIFKEG